MQLLQHPTSHVPPSATALGTDRLGANHPPCAPTTLVKMKLDREPTKKDTENFKKHIKRALGIFHGSDTRTKMDFKLFGPGQTWEMMLGLLLERRGEAHITVPYCTT